ncbi:hypothetical protein PHMEG_00032818, partial [Phytophthora megakarya]
VFGIESTLENWTLLSHNIEDLYILLVPLKQEVKSLVADVGGIATTMVATIRNEFPHLMHTEPR